MPLSYLFLDARLSSMARHSRSACHARPLALTSLWITSRQDRPRTLRAWPGQTILWCRSSCPVPTIGSDTPHRGLVVGPYRSCWPHWSSGKHEFWGLWRQRQRWRWRWRLWRNLDFRLWLRQLLYRFLDNPHSSWVSARRGPHPVSSRSPFSTGRATFTASGAAPEVLLHV